MAIKILLFSFFFLFVQILAGKDDPSLGLIQENVDDAVNAPKKAAMRWTSVLTFPKVKDVWEDVLGKDPNKLSEVARNGFWQMNKKWNDEGVPKKQHASVMTALAIGKEIYLSSSLTGAENFLYKFPVADSNHPLAVGLYRCQQNFESIWAAEVKDDPGFNPTENERWPKHKNNAMCGEEMTLLSYFTRHPGDDAVKDLKNAHFMTVRVKRVPGMTYKNLEYNNIIRFDPCATDQLDKDKPIEFGCGQLTKYFGITAYAHDEKKTTEEFTPFEFPKGDGEMIIDTQSITCKDVHPNNPSGSGS